MSANAGQRIRRMNDAITSTRRRLVALDKASSNRLNVTEED